MTHLRWTVPALAAAAMLGNPLPLSSQQAAGEFPFEKYALENGLEVILAPDRSVPTVTVNVWYDVGARNERPGMTGFAHLFEHMMFEGSANVGKGEHMKMLAAAGSSNYNGTTGADRTNYYEVVPPNRVNLALWLEADRMRSLNVSAENLKNQQEVVKEEKRMRVDNAPYSATIQGLIGETTFNPQSCFAYGHMLIGSMEDLDAASLDDVQAFFRTYYAPNNATLTVSGDFDPAQVRALIQEMFGGLQPADVPPAIACTTPFSHLPVERSVVDKNATLPGVAMSFGAVPVGHPDSYAVELLMNILTEGEASRMNQRLVKQERAALQLVGFPYLQKDAGAVLFFGVANQGVATDRLSQLISEEIAKVSRGGVTAPELERAKNQFRASRLRSLQTSLGRAEALQQADFYFDDPAALRTELDRYMAVTVEDLRRVAQRYLVPSNRALVVIESPTSAQR